jgi:signal peptidase I
MAAFILAGLTILTAIWGQVVLLPTALIPLMAGIGIMRRRAWSAYGFGLYQLGQVLVLLLLAFRYPGATPHWTLAAGVLPLALIPLFFSAGRSLAGTQNYRGRAWPWIALFALSSLPLCFVQPFVIPTGAMENTILIGDRILVQRYPVSVPKNGDIVVFAYPVDRTQTFVKRVIGAPGDRIRISDKIVFRNGTRLNETYAVHKTDYTDSYRDNFPSEPNMHIYEPAQEMLARHVVKGEVVVPDGKYFVMGDNRDSSLDSRYWGFVSIDDLIGKPLVIYDSQEQSEAIVEGGKQPPPRRRRWERIFKFL